MLPHVKWKGLNLASVTKISVWFQAGIFCESYMSFYFHTLHRAKNLQLYCNLYLSTFSGSFEQVLHLYTSKKKFGCINHFWWFIVARELWLNIIHRI